ncbi:MAG: hypothetical protein HEP71_26405 [Roseivirga sp.]|nr:hypothetical protein [Roseivirga sp.]
MKNYKWTAVGLGLAVAMLGIALFFDLDFFESFCTWLIRYERFELDEFVFPVITVLVFLIIDLVRFKKDRNVKEAREGIYKAMVQASDHVLKNCLNQMQIIKYAAEETPDFDPEVLKSFDAIMEQAVTQLEALGEIENVDKEAIAKSINIKIFE